MLVVTGFVALIVFLFVIPVYAHFDVSLLNVIKHAATIAISHPLHVIGMFVTVIAFWYLALAFVNIERKLNQ